VASAAAGAPFSVVLTLDSSYVLQPQAFAPHNGTRRTLVPHLCDTPIEQSERQSNPKLFVGLDGLTLRPAHYSNARYPRAQIIEMLAATPLMLSALSWVDSARIGAISAVEPPH